LAKIILRLGVPLPDRLLGSLLRKDITMEEYLVSKADTIEIGLGIIVVITAMGAVGCFFGTLHALDMKPDAAPKLQESSLRFLALFISSLLCLVFLHRISI